MRLARALPVALMLHACGAARAAEPIAVLPSTHRDPPTHLPPPSSEPHTGATVGVALTSGDDQARDTLVALVLAMRDGDRDALQALCAPTVLNVGTLAPGRARVSNDRAAFADQLLVHARIGSLPRDVRFEELIDPETVRVEPASRAFQGGLPAELVPADVVVHFRVTQLGRRALSILANDGTGVLVVRPGDRAQVIAR